MGEKSSRDSEFPFTVRKENRKHFKQAPKHETYLTMMSHTRTTSACI